VLGDIFVALQRSKELGWNTQTVHAFFSINQFHFDRIEYAVRLKNESQASVAADSWIFSSLLQVARAFHTVDHISGRGVDKHITYTFAVAAARLPLGLSQTFVGCAVFRDCNSASDLPASLAFAPLAAVVFRICNQGRRGGQVAIFLLWHGRDDLGSSMPQLPILRVRSDYPFYSIYLYGGLRQSMRCPLMR
jgi:hypothetical protein